MDYGMNAPAKEYDGVNKYIRITDIDENSSEYSCANIVSPDGALSDKYLVNKNDILFARTGSSTGKTYLYRPADGRLYFAGFLIRANVKDDNDSNFIYYQCKLKRYWNWVRIMSARSGQPGINSQEYSAYTIYSTSKDEQIKISSLLTLLDERIATQRRLIEDLEKLKSSIIDKCYRGTDHIQLGDFITQISNRNKSNLPYKVMSVSNVRGFVPQSEQFADREIASENTTSYKIVTRNIFAYNPARINIGSIARFKGHDNGIVSPMYVCFKVEGELQPQFLEYFFQTRKFKNDVEIRLEGSVRRCLNFDALCEIEIPLLSLSKQIVISSALETVIKKIAIEKGVLSHIIKQRKYLISNMFI